MQGRAARASTDPALDPGRTGMRCAVPSAGCTCAVPSDCPSSPRGVPARTASRVSALISARVSARFCSSGGVNTAVLPGALPSGGVTMMMVLPLPGSVPGTASLVCAWALPRASRAAAAIA